MKAFTDSQLKALKENAICFIDTQQGFNVDLESLINRLEKAEAALIEQYSLSGPITGRGIEWRASKGEGND